ncbi:MAG: hypothetical protein JO044_10740 [Mycobacteriaceae bacterium]|nr:hypothetical protein [Mycobacteriaceae bacterium]MBV9640581.1 hypothetical protein [Mycobacteriaceae bacterium]
MTIQAAPDEGAQAPELAVQPDVIDQKAGPAPTLITEQEVLLGTAAALHVLSAVSAPPRPAPKRYPQRSASYYDSSLTSRAGYRL